MAEFTRSVGDVLILSLQLALNDSTKYVRAYLYDEDGTALGTADLTHVDNGLYQEITEVMPAVSQVRAQYIVYTDSGYTTESTAYSISMDTFDVAASISVEVPNVAGDITGYIDDSPEILTGVIETC